MKRTAFIAFFVVTLVYIGLGSMVFHFIEGANEREEKKTFELDYSKFLDAHTCLSPEELRDYMAQVMAASSRGVPVMSIIAKGSNQSVNGTWPDEHHDSQWDMVSTVLFSVTVVSTIGYGRIAPKTKGGQAFCILFALIGIPLFATCLVGVGERLQIPLQRIKKCRAWYKNDPKKDEKLKTGVFLTSGICLLIFIPSYVLSKTEGWSYIESLYFCIITLTTVGFGDYLPGRPGELYYLHRIILCVWILLGLSWVALIFSELASIMKEHIVEAARKTSNKFGDLEDRVMKKAKDARDRIAHKDVNSDTQETTEDADVALEDNDCILKKSSSRLSPKSHRGDGNSTSGNYRSLEPMESNADNKKHLDVSNQDEVVGRENV